MHTPGPWTACFAVAGPILDGALLGWHITAPEFGSNDPVCERRDGFDRSQRTDDEERANARLIAAAPDLYEALEPVLRGARDADYYCPDDVADDHTVLVSFTIAELRAARAALSKASHHQGSPQAQGAQDSEAKS